MRSINSLEGSVGSMGNKTELTSPLKVAIVSTSLSREAGGILPIMQNHAVELLRLGIDVSGHGLLDAFSDSDRPGWGEVPLHLAPRIGFKRAAFSTGLRRSISEVEPDLVHLHGLWQHPSMVVNTWRRKSQRPVVISTQGMLEPWARSNAGLKKSIARILFERQNLENSSVIHCSSAEIEGVRSFGLKNPIAVLPNGAEMRSEKSPHARPKFLPTAAQKVLLFLGRIHPKKGLIETLQGFSKFASSRGEVNSDWHLVIAGWDDGGHRSEIEAEAKRLGLNDSVSFPGPIFGDEKEALLQNADAFVLASYSEGFPMAVLEAWSHSLPVFCTRECNIPEGYDAGAAIEITTDPENIAQQFQTYLTDAHLTEIGRKGEILIKQRFSWPKITAELAAVYRWVLGIGERPTCIDLQ